MRISFALIFTAAGTAAQAHPGHLIEVAGHDHWVAGAAIALAGLTALWGAAKAKKKDKDALEAEEEATEEDAEEAAA